MFLHKQEYILGDMFIIFTKDDNGNRWLDIEKTGKKILTLKEDDAIDFMKIMRDTKFIFSEGNLGDNELT